MKRVKLLLALATISLLMITVACDKDKKDEPTDPIITKKCYLTQMIWEEDKDTITFEYDNNHRVINIKSGTNWNDVIDYNAEGKIERITNFINGDDRIRASYEWEVKKVTITTDYKTEEGVWETENHKVIMELDSKEQVIKERKYILYEENWKEYSYIDHTWLNENKAESTYWVNTDTKKELEYLNKFMTFRKMFPVFTKDYVKNKLISYEYDNKNSWTDSFYGYFDLNLSKNNVTKEIQFDMNGDEVSRTEYSYEYNEHDYPSKTIMKWTYNSEIEVETFLLKYDFQ